MKVTFRAPQKLGNVAYPAGTQEVPDVLAHNLAFKALVRSGGIHVHPLDQNAQMVRASRDDRAMKLAQARVAQAAEKVKATIEEKKSAEPDPVEEKVSEEAAPQKKAD